VFLSPEEATDPVCGMSVAIATAEHTLVHDAQTYYFCSAHCRRSFEAALV
jgi:P-type Cu+ transporter